MTEKEDQRAKFLTAVAAHEDDDFYHQIYADWLEEHGEYEEGDRQRKWTKAKQWIVDFCEGFADEGEERNAGGQYDYTNREYVNYKNLVARATRSYKECKADNHGDLSFSIGSAQSLGNDLNYNDEHKREFWKNWSIVTGNSLPQEWVENSSFSCSC